MGTKNVLGRGVEALLPNGPLEDDDRFFMCDIERIQPNPNQPRSYFDKEKLAQLADSIRKNGIIQPLLVTQGKGNRYNLIAGERRLRAAKLADRDEIPVMVMQESSDHDSLELALIENIQRHDLNPIEEASAYTRLIDEFNMTQEEVAKKVGRQRSTISNLIRLLHLPKSLQADVAQGTISEGHARVLLRLKDDPEQLKALRDKIITEQLSVRQTERLCSKQRLAQSQKNVERGKKKEELPKTYCKAVTNQLTNHLNTKTRIIQSGKRGKLEIEYYSSDDLDRLLSILTD